MVDEVLRVSQIDEARLEKDIDPRESYQLSEVSCRGWIVEAVSSFPLVNEIGQLTLSFYFLDTPILATFDRSDGLLNSSFQFLNLVHSFPVRVHDDQSCIRDFAFEFELRSGDSFEVRQRRGLAEERRYSWKRYSAYGRESRESISTIHSTVNMRFTHSKLISFWLFLIRSTIAETLSFSAESIS